MVYFTKVPSLQPKSGVPKARSSNPNSWSLFTICDTNDHTKSRLLADLNNLRSTEDQTHAKQALSKFEDRLLSGGAQLSTFFVKKGQFHQTLTYFSQVKQKDEKVLRVWLAGEIRIYFVCENRNVIILKVIAKRENKLSQGENTTLENAAEEVFSSIKSYTFNARIVP